MSTDSPLPHGGQTFLARFGATVLSGGIAPIPTALYMYQAHLGLSPQEIWFIGYILAHKWDEDLPYPSLVKMSERTAISTRHLHRLKDGLIAKGLLEIVPRRRATDGGKDSNAYDFGPLFARLADLIRHYGPRGERLDTAPSASHPPVTPASHGDVTPAAHGPLTLESVPPMTAESYEEDAGNQEPSEEEPPPGPLPGDAPGVVGVVEDQRDQIQQDTDLLVALGVDEETAAVCAATAFANGRPPSYVAEQIAYVQRAPNIKDPLAVVITNIKKNLRRRPPSSRPMAPLAPPRPHPLPRYLDKPSEPQNNHPAIDPADADPATGRPDLAPRADDWALVETWQRALMILRACVSPEEYQRWIYPIRLIELDTDRRAALLGLPNPALCNQVQTRLAPFVCTALDHVCGVQLRIFMIALPGPDGGAMPTLAGILAEQPPGAGVSVGTEGGAG
jgi:hypothetical protein